MKKKWRTMIGVSTIAMMGIVVGSITALTTSNIIKLNPLKDFIYTSNDASIITNDKMKSLIEFKKMSNGNDISYQINIVENKENSFANIYFENNLKSIVVNCGDIINLYVKDIQKNYSISDMLVYDTEQTNYLDIKKVDKNIFSFKFPQAINQDFISLTVETFYINNNMQEFECDYSSSLDTIDLNSNSFIYNLTENTILDDNTKNNLMQFINTLKQANVFENKAVNVTIFLNNFILEVNEFNVPANCNLIFLNNKNDSGLGIVKGYNNNIGNFIVSGMITRWNSVKFEKISINSSFQY